MNSYEVFTNVPLSGDSLFSNSGRSIPENKAVPIRSGDESKSCPHHESNP